MKTKIAAVLLGIALSLPVLAQGPVAFGNYDCGQWVAGRQPARAWVLGFLSGMNLMYATKDSAGPLDKVNSADQIYLWLDNYCRANPLQKVGDGAWALFMELSLGRR